MITMDCQDFQKSLFDWEDGEFYPETRIAMESHVLGCESCSRLLAGFRAFEVEIEAEKSREVPPFAATRILQKLENEKEKRQKAFSHILQPAIITFLLVAAIVTGFLVGNHGTTRQSQAISSASQVELLKSELFVADFLEEDNTLLTNY
jgi:anti-sigma factor RsiW